MLLTLFLQSLYGAETVSLNFLYESGHPVLFIQTQDNQLPTAEIADPPEGCVGGSIKNKTTVYGRMFIVRNHNDTIYDSGEYQKDVAGMSIRLRGNWTGRQQKAAYKLKLEKKADLIANEESFKDKQWLLKFDELMYPHVMTALKISELMKLPWTPRYTWVHLVLNGKYRGLYQIVESVKRNTNCRINISTSGYIIEYDAYWWNEDVWFSTPLHEKYGYMNFTFKYPDDEDVTDEKMLYISDYMKMVEASIPNGQYTKFIDVESFARWLLAIDILGVSDAAGANIFLTKYDDTDQSLLRMSNLWDFDTIMRTKSLWAASHNFFYFPMLFASVDNSFLEAFVMLWETEGLAAIDATISYIKAFKDSPESEILKKSLALDHQRWSYYNVNLDDYLDSVVVWLQERKALMGTEISKMRQSLIAEPILHQPSEKQNVMEYYDIMGRKLYPVHGRWMKKSPYGHKVIVF